MKLYVTEEKIAEWKNNRTASIQRWVEMVSRFNNRELPFSNLRKLPEFFFCLPGTNASTGRIFSLMNSFWTSDKTKRYYLIKLIMKKIVQNFIQCFKAKRPTEKDP